MEVISFDYDGTLTQRKYQDKVEELLLNDIKVLILTARQNKDMAPVYYLAKKLGINKRNVHNTNGEDKWKYINRLGITKHYDNNKEQIDKINKNTGAKGILV